MAWILIRSGEANSALSGHKEFQLDSAADINNPPEEAQKAAPDSKAWTGDYVHIWNKKNDGSWFDIVEGA